MFRIEIQYPLDIWWYIHTWSMWDESFPNLELKMACYPKIKSRTGPVPASDTQAKLWPPKCIVHMFQHKPGSDLPRLFGSQWESHDHLSFMDHWCLLIVFFSMGFCWVCDSVVDDSWCILMPFSAHSPFLVSQKMMCFKPPSHLSHRWDHGDIMTIYLSHLSHLLVLGYPNMRPNQITQFWFGK